MFVSLALAAIAAQGISVALGNPRQVERPIAPIEETGPLWARYCKDWDEWNAPAPPVRIHGNTYLVGTCGISAILITGSDGHILIDGGTERGADLIAANIKALGFRLTDIRYLLHSHEHHDHVGGLARLQALTGAQLVASAKAAPVLGTGRAAADDPQAGKLEQFPPARVERIIGDRGTVRLGNLLLTAIATPGHTDGALSWTWLSCDGGVCRQMVYADSLSPVSRDDYRFSDHPDRVAAFRKSIERVGALECDILLTPHPSASDMRTRMAKKQMTDTDGCKAYAAKLTSALDERLAKEQPK